jgi:methylmalonyl-CoA mutase N-terminal domain/subunit
MKMKYEDLVKRLIEKYPERQKKFLAESSDNSTKNLLRVDEKLAQLQVKKLHKIKAARDVKIVHENIEKRRKIYRTEENLIPSILKAVKTYATLGEICNVLRKKFGEYNEPIVV